MSSMLQLAFLRSEDWVVYKSASLQQAAQLAN